MLELKEHLGKSEARNALMLDETANKTMRTVEALDTTLERLVAIQDHQDSINATALGL